MTSREVKQIAYSLGAELCGIAGLDRFSGAPEGYHPRDVWPGCQSVISFACRFPAAVVACGSAAAYTRVRNSITAKMDAIALDLCIELEKRGVKCVPVPTNESQWDEKTDRWRSIVSQKHAAQAAGLGTIRSATPAFQGHPRRHSPSTPAGPAPLRLKRGLDRSPHIFRNCRRPALSPGPPPAICGRRGKESLLVIREVTGPLTVHDGGEDVLIAERDYAWVQIALEELPFWLTAMYDDRGRLIQIYFDITAGNRFDDPDDPTFVDMYLDIVVNSRGELFVQAKRLVR